MNKIVVVVTGFLMSPCLSHAAGTQNELPESLIACMNEFDVMNRLSCYDRQMSRLTSTEKENSLAATEYATTEDTSEAAAPAPEEQLVVSTNLTEQQQPQSQTVVKPLRTELTATILKISKRPYGERVVSLDNDQVWAEKIPSSSFKVHVGERITIKKGRFGGYRLYGRGSRSTEVKRIR